MAVGQDTPPPVISAPKTLTVNCTLHSDPIRQAKLVDVPKDSCAWVSAFDLMTHNPWLIAATQLKNFPHLYRLLDNQKLSSYSDAIK